MPAEPTSSETERFQRDDSIRARVLQRVEAAHQRRRAMAARACGTRLHRFVVERYGDYHWPYGDSEAL